MTDVPRPDHDAAIQFLAEHIRREGPWCLTSMGPGGIETRVFRDQAQMRDWLERQWEARRNCYFTLNPIQWDDVNPRGKPAASMLTAVVGAHADLDIDKTVTPEELDDALHGATAKLRRLSPAPSIIWRTGGGLQCVWLFHEALTGHDEIRAAVNINRAILRTLKGIGLEGDAACVNPVNLLRLPGTVNFPNEAKLARGRVPSLAHVVFDTDGTYPASQFPRARGTVGLSDVDLQFDFEHVDLDELRLSETLRRQIETGEVPGASNDRSAAQFRVAMALARLGVVVGVTAGILRSGYGISERCEDLETSKGPDEADREAKRAAVRALGVVNAWNRSTLNAFEAADEDDDKSGGLRVVRGRDVRRRSVKTMYGRFVLGAVTLVAAPGDSGKTAALMAIAAKLTTGGEIPGAGSEPVGDVLVISAEDDAGTTLMPRFDAAKGDDSRIHIVSMMQDGPTGDRPINIARADDVQMIADYLDNHPAVRMLIIDPIGSVIGNSKETDTNRDGDIRTALAPLLALAAERGIAVVIIVHTRKDDGKGKTAAAEKVLGSVGLTNLARSVLMVVKDGSRRYLAIAKMNLQAHADALCFEIVGGQVPGTTEEPFISTAKVIWHEPVKGDADDLLAKSGVGPELRPNKKGYAQIWLANELSDGPRPIADVKAAAARQKIGRDMLHKVKNELGVTNDTLEGVRVWRRDGAGASSTEGE